ncbi:hypothetical protein HJC23_001872 [Cyclotella cryptica]|uniref:Uncharacterized protein n=1 Tax=Cyclotella cryptica TaxID=29204 RepID=A0ABD3PLU1_9STRA|eukprot:CCRYP_013662-RA/>CCRYP_013662-RA protein AED:0.00 eAED:0.00 QI:155/1/1/1/1/0.66/3/612/162
MGKSTNRQQRQQRSADTTDEQDTASLTMCRWKNLLIVTSGMLLPIGPALILTLHAHAHATKLSCVAGQDSSLQCPSSAHYNASDASHRRKTWQDYMKESAEQIIEGSEEEQRRSEERFRQMEKYLQRSDTKHTIVDPRLTCIDTSILILFLGGCQIMAGRRN